MTQNKISIFLLLLVSALFVFNACQDPFTETPGSENDKYLVSFEQYKTISLIEIQLAFSQLTGLFPDTNIDDLIDAIEFSTRIFKVKYNTTFQGEAKIASGIVCIPIGEGPFPLLSYQNGTNTLHSEAPSVNPDRELYLFLESVSSAGFVIVVADYLGFGESDDMIHPYLDKESSVQPVADLLMATKELAASHNLKANISDDLYISGYSQGGWLTLALQKEMETNYTNEFNLKASACGAGPYNLFYINNHVQNLSDYPMPYFLGYMLNTYSSLGYITNPLSEIINEPYASKIPTLYDGTKTGDEINDELTTSVSELFTEDYRNNYLAGQKYSSVRTTLMSNSIEAWNISTPLLLIHGGSDSFVPPQVTLNMYQDMISLGVSETMIQKEIIPNTDHSGGIIPSGIASIKWFLDIKNN